MKLSEMKVPQTAWETPSFVSRASKIAKKAYIRGFWDAEGGLPITTKQCYISFDQNNKTALDFVRKTLIEFGYHPTNLTFTSYCWQFRITRKNELKRFFFDIGTWHPDKDERFRKMLGALFPLIGGGTHNEWRMRFNWI